MERTTVENLKELDSCRTCKDTCNKSDHGELWSMLCLRRSIRQISQFTKTRL